jgi:hypothetical protein
MDGFNTQHKYTGQDLALDEIPQADGYPDPMSNMELEA